MTSPPTDYSALTPKTIPAYLVQHGHINNASAIESIHLLSGGFANHVFLVKRKNAPPLILKQAFAQQVIERGFDLPIDRLEMECRAITLFNRLSESTPPPIPILVSFDETNNLGTFLAWENSHLYMDDLTAGNYDDKIALQLGQSLAQLHNLSVGQTDLGTKFGHNENHRVTLRVQAVEITPDIDFANQINQFIETALTLGNTLIHGDFDPKNILINKERKTLMIDLEQAAVADPAQDVGYLLAHYYLIGLHDELDTAAMLPSITRVANSFWTTYFQTLSTELDHRTIADRTLTYIWIFLLGRINGLAKLPSIRHIKSSQKLCQLAHQRVFSEKNLLSLNNCFQKTFG